MASCPRPLAFSRSGRDVHRQNGVLPTPARARRPGYHPHVDVGGNFTSCAIESLGDETVFEFEQEYTVRMRLLFPDQYRDMFAVGSAVRFFECSRPVGQGIILDIL